MKTLLFAMAFLACLSSYAQGTVKLEKGKKLELTLHTVSKQTTMGNSTIDATVVRSFDVEEANADSTVIEHKIKKLQFSANSLMGDMSYDSEKGDDVNGEMGKAMGKTLKNKYTFTIDRSGMVVSASKKEIPKDDDKSATPQDQMVMSVVQQFAGNLDAPAVGSMLELKVLSPRSNLASGSSWTDSTSDGSTKYTVTAVSDNEITLSYTGTRHSVQEQEAMGMKATITNNEKISGTLKADRTTGLLKERTETSTSEGSMSAGGHSMPMSATTTRTWTLK